MMNKTARAGIALFFYTAFAVFLLPSVPHIAYFFRGFEPINDGFDQFWWIVAYAIAGVIDTTVLLMTWAESKLAREQKPFWWMRSFVWLFISLATAMSIFANWQYAVEFASPMLANVRVVHPFLVDVVDPIVASLFPLFQIIYSRIADVIIGKDMSIDDLQSRLNDLNNRQPLLDQLAAHRQQKTEQNVTRLAGSIGRVFGAVRESIGTQKAIQSGEKSDSMQTELTNQSENNVDENRVTPGEIHAVPTPMASASMTHIEAAQYLGITESTVLKLKRQGVIKAAGKSKTLVTRKSVEAHHNSRSKRIQSGEKVAVNA